MHAADLASHVNRPGCIRTLSWLFALLAASLVGCGNGGSGQVKPEVAPILPPAKIHMDVPHADAAQDDVANEQEMALLEELRGGETGLKRNAAMRTLGEVGSLASYPALREEFLRPSLVLLKSEVQPDSVRYSADLAILQRGDAGYGWHWWSGVNGEPEAERYETALKAMIVLTGWIVEYGDLSDRATRLKLAAEFDRQIAQLPAKRREILMLKAIPALVDVLKSPDASPDRLKAAITLLTHYAGMWTEPYLWSYLPTRPADLRAKDWREWFNSIRKTYRWNDAERKFEGLCDPDFPLPWIIELHTEGGNSSWEFLQESLEGFEADLPREF